MQCLGHRLRLAHGLAFLGMPVFGVTLAVIGLGRGCGPHLASLALPSGPDQADDTVYELLIDACFAAAHRIVAITPYFVPDPALVMASVLAARRGVTVDLLLPRRSNHRLADLARPPRRA
jgi:phosphatidylserine/phosphatidylglycerophosphate/cardiolipin synthase-like enzyme